MWIIIIESIYIPNRVGSTTDDSLKTRKKNQVNALLDLNGLISHRKILLPSGHS